VKSQMWWYTARAGGIVAWALSAGSVVWGLLLSSRVLGRRISGPKLLDLHRFLGGLAVVFTGVHLSGLVLDSTVHFGPVEILVPFASEWHPGAVAWGVVAFYVLLAVEITSLLRRRVGERVWRAVHYGGFLVFLFGTIHGLKAGTDVENPLIWWPAAAASAAIVGLCANRIFANGDPVPRREKRHAITGERPAAELLERTLEGLRQLDDAPTVVAPVAFDAPPAVPEGPFVPRPAPLTPTQAVSGALFPSTDEVRAVPGPLDLTVPAGFDDGGHDEIPPAPPRPFWPPDITPLDPAAPEPPQPIRIPPAEPAWSSTPPAGGSPATDPIVVGDGGSPGAVRALPVRTPRRLSRTTVAAASLDAWRPARAAEVASQAAPPAPPTEVDPTTGEPDPQAYRKWLREWLAYVESHA